MFNKLKSAVSSTFSKLADALKPKSRSEKIDEIREEIKKDPTSFEKGTAFELCCLDIFPEKDFDLLEMTHNPDSANGRFVKSDLNPDLQFKDKKTGNNFSVECKYRSSLFKGAFSWAKNKAQADRYREYEKENEIPVFIAMGLGGTPEKPEQIFLMPLKEIKYNSLFPSVLKDYEIKEAKDVFKILK
ncbi:hypothetical protein [Methanococcus maripaludis]|jgi:hypothetical protein|uniref:Uncharacterized protein n=3 Tax=Methanococcus maripaludis TaxID=39152 RepID=A0A2Z5PKA9_METMI|nr:hypothetical protein [Methanococcus maripaludis]AEK19322.1 hypothetical protein GYY_02195 [Methanococcus maripaludis X1]BAP60560.1 hypothetical protein MMKA1_04430 [Methanococcus maripaludis KA1]BAP62525.1 hypothetical protein MMOS7_04390 [Methanococcus maripaludis OS7]